ncbi:pleckstrin homology domain-containing family O member 2 [Engraulis encrasicolus]|uniref:pleckstrin homology domain-containing family O member 2 n=1 Tax=Engraulis encrasicolus TaxID=184585 RepID=UPI002FCF2A92
MEDGGKEDTAKPKEVKFTGKAGWLKKSSGKIFGTYKDRYIQLEHTEVVVYENEELKTCLEKLDLENYEKCHELRGAFKKKNRLILIKAPKCANKVHDVKLQAQNQEEKDAWIKAFSDGINRAKNKIFDEVKVEEGCSLEHVTRTRPKGNRGRRPPTRIHMKEAANVSSDGILRLDLDLDLTDSTPNGTHYVNIEDGAPKETSKSNDDEATSGSAQDEPASETPTPQKKVLKPPMPPSKQQKPSSTSEEDAHGETTSDSGVDTGAPPTPSKPSSSQDDLSSDSSTAEKEPKPPKPPSKDKKPALVDEEEAKETLDDADNDEEEEGEEAGGKEKRETEESETQKAETEEDEGNEEDKNAVTDELTVKAVPKPSVVMWDTPLPETSSEPEQRETEMPEEERSTPEPMKKVSGPPAPPKKKPIKSRASSKDDEELSDAKKKGHDESSSSSELISGSVENLADGQPESNTPASVSPEPLAKSEALTPSTTTTVSVESVEPCELSTGKVEKVVQEEQKSIDSGQHSAEESEIGDTTSTTTSITAMSVDSQTAVQSGSNSKEDETQPSLKSLKQSDSEGPSNSAKTPSSSQEDSSCARVSTPPPSTQSKKPQILSPRPLVPLKPKSKVRSASVGDLLADPPEEKTQKEHSGGGGGGPSTAAATAAPDGDVKNLQSTVTLELKNTGELLHTIADKQTTVAKEGEENNQGELKPEELLATAMEKLKKAEEILSVAKSFKQKTPVDKENKRMSW